MFLWQCLNCHAQYNISAWQCVEYQNAAWSAHTHIICSAGRSSMKAEVFNITYSFTNTSSSTCKDIRLPHQRIEHRFLNKTFTARILTTSHSIFRGGETSTATIMLLGLEGTYICIKGTLMNTCVSQSSLCSHPLFVNITFNVC